MTNQALIFAVCAACVVVVIGGLIVVRNLITSKRNRDLDARADARYKRWQQALQAAGGELSPCLLPIHLDKGEEGFYCDETAKLYELRAIRNGNLGGASFRVAKGITIHSGGFRSESHDEWREIARGALYVTNKRIIFNGDKKNRIIKLSDVMSVDRGYRVATVNSDQLQKPIAFGSINGQMFADIVDALCEVDRPSKEEYI